MRKIEENMKAAVFTMKNWQQDNTQVKVYTKGGFKVLDVYLHGNKIFEGWEDGRQFFTLAGWNTVTTKSRLRALGVNIRQKNGDVILNNSITIDENKWYSVDEKHI